VGSSEEREETTNRRGTQKQRSTTHWNTAPNRATQSKRSAPFLGAEPGRWGGTVRRNVSAGGTGAYREERAESKKEIDGSGKHGAPQGGSTTPATVPVLNQKPRAAPAEPSGKSGKGRGKVRTEESSPLSLAALQGTLRTSTTRSEPEKAQPLLCRESGGPVRTLITLKHPCRGELSKEGTLVRLNSLTEEADLLSTKKKTDCTTTTLPKGETSPAVGRFKPKPTRCGDHTVKRENPHQKGRESDDTWVDQPPKPKREIGGGACQLHVAVFKRRQVQEEQTTYPQNPCVWGRFGSLVIASCLCLVDDK